MLEAWKGFIAHSDARCKKKTQEISVFVFVIFSIFGDKKQLYSILNHIFVAC